VEWRYLTPDGVAVLGVANDLFYGVVSHLTSGMLEGSALVALRADTGKLLWRVEIGTMKGIPLVG
jgi:outer membrane protein assembly factor BamB